MSAPPAANGARSQPTSAGSTPKARHALPERPPAPANPTPAVPVTYGGASYTGNGAYGTPTWTRSNNGNGRMVKVPRFGELIAKPTTVPTASYDQSYYPTMPAGTSMPMRSAYSSASASYATAAETSNYPPNAYNQQQYQYYSQPYTATPPQGTNSYAAPTVNDVDAEQLAQWQSGFGNKDDSKKGLSSVTSVATTTEAGTSAADGKKTVVRHGGGKTWEDPTLLDWDPKHFRLFVGNLAGEVVDKSLEGAFKAYTSLSRAHVIRDARTNKSRGYGFVAFANADDYFRAFKEMQGKYIGGHPIQLKKAKEITAAPTASGGHFLNGGNNNRNRNNRGRNNNPNSVSMLANASNNVSNANVSRKGNKNHGQAGQSGPSSYAGITKNNKKTKGGLKLLG